MTPDDYLSIHVGSSSEASFKVRVFFMYLDSLIARLLEVHYRVICARFVQFCERPMIRGLFVYDTQIPYSAFVLLD